MFTKTTADSKMTSVDKAFIATIRDKHLRGIWKKALLEAQDLHDKFKKSGNSAKDQGEVQ